MTRFWPLAMCALLVVVPLTAQAPPSFEVASIKSNRSGEVLYSIAFQPGGRLNATNAPLRELVRAAYGIQNHQLEGGPNWIGSERFDVIAKAEDERVPSRILLRTLLNDRFKLSVHDEKRELAVYVLEMERNDRRLGPRLRRSNVDCNAVMALVLAQGERPGIPRPGERQACDMFTGFPPRLAAEGVSMAQLAASLSRFVDRVVVDRTGLSGIFDFELEWTPELPGVSNGPVRLNGVDVDPTGPSLFTALREQLGLKLEATKAPVEVLVIDHVERPTED